MSRGGAVVELLIQLLNNTLHTMLALFKVDKIAIPSRFKGVDVLITLIELSI